MMVATLSGVLGLNVLQLVALDSALEAVHARILPEVMVARIALVLDLTQRPRNALLLTLAQVKAFADFHLKAKS